MTFEIPYYTGPGRYDLGALAQQRGREIDPFRYCLALGYREEAYYGSPDFGPMTLDVAEGEKVITLQMTVQGASGELCVAATVTLPDWARARSTYASELLAQTRVRVDKR